MFLVMDDQRQNDICQTVELMRSHTVDDSCGKAPMASTSKETYYTAADKSREPSTHSVKTSSFISEAENMEGQMYKCELGNEEKQIIRYTRTEEGDRNTVICSNLEDQELNDKHIPNLIAASVPAHSCTDRVINTIHNSNHSIPCSKSIDSGRRSHGPCRSNHLGSRNTSMFSEGVVCRICHEGDSSEVLVSPCYCSGSMGLIHVSCLQTWLGSSNKTTCEICNFQFSLVRKTMPFIQFLKNPGTTQDRRNVICDTISFLVITPLTIVVVWICLKGAEDHFSDSEMEQGGLISLSVCLLCLYAIWFALALRNNYNLWKDWKMFHQEVTLLCEPSTLTHSKSEGERWGSSSHSQHGSVRLQSVRINVNGPLTNFKRKKEKTNTKPHSTNQQVEKNPSTAGTMLSHGNSSRLKLAQHHQPNKPAGMYSEHVNPIVDQRNNSIDHYNNGCSSHVCEPPIIRKHRKIYDVESNMSGKVSHQSSSDQSSFNAVFETRDHDGSRHGYTTGIRHGGGSYRDRKRRQQYVCDRGSDTVRSTDSYPTSGEHRPDTHRSDTHRQAHYRPASNRSDSLPPALPSIRPVLAKQSNTQSTVGIFSRGGSPSEDKSHDYIAKWVKDHTKTNNCNYNQSKLETRGSDYSIQHECRNKACVIRPTRPLQDTDFSTHRAVAGSTLSNEKDARVFHNLGDTSTSAAKHDKSAIYDSNSDPCAFSGSNVKVVSSRSSHVTNSVSQINTVNTCTNTAVQTTSNSVTNCCPNDAETELII